ncbi:MAG: ABC transporter substrate-binding protein [Azospirillaceae bacterium]|nr:ABC transporter substrate-binding protein [Azospirillaceae bacterium]
MRSPLHRRAAIAALALLTLLPGLNTARAETPPAVIRIGTPGALGPDGQPVRGSAYGQATIDALEQEFAGTGTKIEWKYFVNVGPGINEAFAGHQIDFANYGDFPAIIARSSGIPIKLLSPVTRGSLEAYLVVPNGSTAKTIQDLKGKRVAVNMGRPWMLAFSHLLAANNLKMSDFQIYNLVMPDGDAAVAAGTVDAQFTLNGLQLQSRGLAKPIWSTLDAPLEWKFVADLFGSEDFINKYPETTQRLVRAYVRGALYYSQPEHREEYLQNLAKFQATPYDLIAKEWAHKDAAMVLSPRFDSFVSQHYQQAIDYAFDNKLIRRKFQATDLFEPRFAEAALKELEPAQGAASGAAKGATR